MVNELFNTPRLSIYDLSLDDDQFILDLVNTPGWLEFIGNRYVHDHLGAKDYIQTILENKNIKYWVVRLKNEPTEVGVVTFIKRDELDYSDIGFAFLPEYTGHGYAFEAVQKVLNEILKTYAFTYILATTRSENTNSIKLIEKLGFTFDKQTKDKKVTNLIYRLDVS